MGVQTDHNVYVDDGPSSSNGASSSKRKLPNVPHAYEDDDDDDGYGYGYGLGVEPKRTKKVQHDTAAGGEKRLRRYRPKAPQSFEAIYERAMTQRFYVLSRTRCGTADCPEEMIELTGSTGNIYTVCIARQPICDCPHARAGNQCKHVVYVMARILRAKHELVYQLAFLRTELQEIFANAPPILVGNGVGGHTDKNRKDVDGDCPICFEHMETGDGNEPLVWCKAACGQNVHGQCFEMWAATKRQNGNSNVKVTCPCCRSVWEGDDDMVRRITRAGKLSSEGYVNVADQLGISTERDFSTYSTWWSGHPDYRGSRRRSYLDL